MTAPPRPAPAFVRRIDRMAGENVIPFPPPGYIQPPVIHPLRDDCTGPEFKPSGTVRVAEACTGLGIAVSCAGLLIILALLWRL